MNRLATRNSRRHIRQCLSGFVLSALYLTGCGLRNAEYNPVDQRANLAGATQLFPVEEFEKIDLALLLDPLNKRNTDPGCVAVIGHETHQVDAAFIAFNHCYKVENAGDNNSDGLGEIELKRNQIQERILQVSDQYCNVFKVYLQRARSGTNFSLGSLSTIAGVAGGVVTGLDGSRILSGLSGVFSGIRAEFNQQYFLNLVMPVITKGIELKRSQIYSDMVNHGQALPYGQYEVEAAVKNAIAYHGACSITAAFETAEESIETVDDPGLDAAHKTVLRVNAIRRALNQGTTDLKAFRKIRKIGYLEAGKPFPPDSEEIETKLPAKTLADEVNAIRMITDGAQVRIGTDPSLGKLDGAVVTLNDSLEDQQRIIETEIGQCRDEGNKRTAKYFEEEAKLRLAEGSAARKRQQAERDIAIDQAHEVHATVRLVRDMYTTYVNRMLVKVTLETVDLTAVQKAAAEFAGDVGKINLCTELDQRAKQSAGNGQEDSSEKDPTLLSDTYEDVTGNSVTSNIILLQRQLTSLGFDPKGIDGVRGDNTNMAIGTLLNLVALDGWKAKETSTEVVLRIITLLSDGLAPGNANPDGFRVIVIERLLVSLGKDPGSIDGIRDAQVNAALTTALGSVAEAATVDNLIAGLKASGAKLDFAAM